MLRKIAAAVSLLCLSFAFAAGDEIKGNILTVSDGKVTIRLKPKEKGMKGEEKTFDLAKEVKVTKKENKELIVDKEGLKSELITGINAKKGAAGSIITNDDNKVTEIVINAKKKKAT